MENFTLNNITETDVKKKIIRILTAERKFFPPEIKGEHQTHAINIVFNGTSFSTTYKTGSRDGKSRSGILKNNFCSYLNSGTKLGSKKTGVKAFDVEIVK